MPSEPVFRRHFVDGMCGLVPYAQSVLSGYAVWYSMNKNQDKARSRRQYK
ncbi:hypothetical protein [Neisseria meningitidis]|nr:hypothetical protein [Neisseria meningitidis]